MIIDAHVHLADELTGFWRPLRHGRVVDHGQVIQAMPPSFDPPASPATRYVAYMEHAGVDMAFLVQHHLYGDQNRTVLEAIRH
jgi:predicted TIM-barrel fold metal-dependent hydrolase